MKKKIAIIGAGIGGLTLALQLKQGADVTVFEKSRGLGGRMATRRVEDFSFDHGAQFFTAREAAFKRFLEPSLASGLVQEWKGKVITFAKGKKTWKRIWYEPHFVCSPGMNSLCKHIAEGVNVRVLCEVAPLRERKESAWELFDTGNNFLGAFDLVISTAPPLQTVRLFSPFLSPRSAIRDEKLLACYTLMVGISKPWAQSWIAAKVLDSPLDWIGINSSKPGRNPALTTIVAQTENSWAQNHVDDDQEKILSILRSELEAFLRVDLEGADHISLHRWRYAIHEKAPDDDFRETPYFDPDLQLASVGDWCGRSRIEDVWLGAYQLARKIIAKS